MYTQLKYPIDLLLDFFQDMHYRNVWDSSTFYANRDPTTNIIQWITKYPFPYRNREYILQRNTFTLKNMHIIYNKSIPKPSNLPTFNSVIVDDYKSHIILKAIDENTTDYCVVYSENNKLNLSVSFQNAFIRKNLRDNIKKIDNAISLYAKQVLYKKS